MNDDRASNTRNVMRCLFIVSSMRVGKEMQFFGFRCRLSLAFECLLYAINGGVDEVSKKQVGPKYRPITSEVSGSMSYGSFQDMMK